MDQAHRMALSFRLAFSQVEEHYQAAQRELENHGALIITDCYTSNQVDELRDMVAAIPEDLLKDSPRGGGYAARNLLNLPDFKTLGQSNILRCLATLALGPGNTPVKATFFDKNPKANWRVPWHQDLSIAVSKRENIAGFGPWSVKAGVVHVQPPRSVLENSIAIRIHLDPSNRETGALHVLPGSHGLGKLSGTEISSMTKGEKGSACKLKAGDVLLMRPLLLHKSPPGAKPRRRRTLHFEYSAACLPNPLEWAFKM